MLVALLDTEPTQVEAAPTVGPALAAIASRNPENPTAAMSVSRLTAHMAASKALRAATAAAASVRHVVAQAGTFAGDPEALGVRSSL